VPTPPRWSGQLGLEWIFRLANEPRRLFARYLIEPWYVLALLMLDYPRNRHGGRLRARAQLGD
jgi:N-acetylglucosaminyldiphosphoundecaprenol N-acetyl-beta-D-mannosaminyltransferase